MSYHYHSYLFHCKIHLLGFHYCYCTLIYFIKNISLYFICNHHITLLFSQLSNQLLCVIFKHNFCPRQMNPHPTHFWSPPHRKHWNTEPYQGSADHCEGECNLGINCLASDNLRQYTTVTNQCRNFHVPERRIFIIVIIDLISRSVLVEFSLLLASKLLLQ